ncbi:TIGR00645 family protein [Pseudoxanthomonas kalamensis DSM 18571]|uniref:TIGR00645 family protein n=1 Tax=Pseudoxanthomonas kalamensis TaxID=289483 RepID=UPI001391BEB7|nr:TIGR00645 family protein [Pseudoxanthomonas kalamensis]KAF1712206.1 TIGR00645 family protein [Pseudoxanthomonas kalamensis DSM 18571]
MSQSSPPRLGFLPALIFASRWLQLPLYLGLIVAQGVYVFLFGKELWHLIHGANELTEQGIMLLVLGLIDVVMISNLLVMVIVGGYETFVSRLNLQGHPDQPEWLSHVNASVLKVKLAMAIIGISSIHLLKTFIAAGDLGMPLCGSSEFINAREMFDAAVESGMTGISAPGCTKTTVAGVMWQTIIHGAFILSAIGIAYTDKVMTGSSARREHASH